jgi:hypothetical protein
MPLTKTWSGIFLALIVAWVVTLGTGILLTIVGVQNSQLNCTQCLYNITYEANLCLGHVSLTLTNASVPCILCRRYDCPSDSCPGCKVCPTSGTSCSNSYRSACGVPCVNRNYVTLSNVGIAVAVVGGVGLLIVCASVAVCMFRSTQDSIIINETPPTSCQECTTNRERDPILPLTGNFGMLPGYIRLYS